jgi:uncharacterized membrane protein YfcA
MVTAVMALVLGAVVGVALGLTGGGGSIFAVPLLIYGALMMIATRSIARRVAGPKLQRTFAVCLVIVGLGMLAANVLRGGWL